MNCTSRRIRATISRFFIFYTNDFIRLKNTLKPSLTRPSQTSILRTSLGVMAERLKALPC